MSIKCSWKIWNVLERLGKMNQSLYLFPLNIKEDLKLFSGYSTFGDHYQLT